MPRMRVDSRFSRVVSRRCDYGITL